MKCSQEATGNHYERQWNAIELHTHSKWEYNKPAINYLKTINKQLSNIVFKLFVSSQ